MDMPVPPRSTPLSALRPLREPAAEGAPKMLQKRSVSSAAADTTVSPSGDCAKWRTRAVWPVSSQSLVMDG